jgi:hypothetical protein
MAHVIGNDQPDEQSDGGGRCGGQKGRGSRHDRSHDKIKRSGVGLDRQPRPARALTTEGASVFSEDAVDGRAEVVALEEDDACRPVISVFELCVICALHRQRIMSRNDVALRVTLGNDLDGHVTR